jgi:DeoR/GlpR family transcriptional regulator of sugar metabolism
LGISHSDSSDGEYSAALCRNSNETYLVADSSKFGKESFYKFLEFSQIDHLITDEENKLDENIVNAVNANDVKLHIVKNKY